MTVDDFIYGPFLDEELFFYDDVRTNIKLDAVQIFDMDQGFVGFDYLEKIYNRGREGSYDGVMFSGVATIKKTSWLCERGFKMLLGEIKRQKPDMNANELHGYCSKNNVKVELHCQLALMPVCYLTKEPANSIVMYSKNENNKTAQRRYIVNTFHISCFRRSELTLQRYMVLKFIVDTCLRYRNEIPRKNRDVHWLVDVYLTDYASIFVNRQRPRLHRSEVYDHFATHAEWLNKVLRVKNFLDRSLWGEWMDEYPIWRRKAKRRKSQWGARLKRPGIPKYERLEQDDDMPLNDNAIDDMLNQSNLTPDIASDESTSDVDSSSSSSSCPGSDENDQYAFPPSLRSRAHRGLFKPMPLPTWYWTCDITDNCPFTIYLGSKEKRDSDAPCMEPLTPKEKDYLRYTMWGLYDKKLGKIWRKMCQAHMDWHWREAGLVLDQKRKRVYGVEEESES